MWGIEITGTTVLAQLPVLHQGLIFQFFPLSCCNHVLQLNLNWMACTINMLPHWDHASTVKCKRKQWKALKWFTLWPFINQEEKNSRKAKFVRFICSFWLNNRDCVCLSCEDIYGTGKSLPEQKRNPSSVPSFIHSQMQPNCVFFFRILHLKWWPLCKRSHWSEQTLTGKVSNTFGAEILILYLNSNPVCHNFVIAWSYAMSNPQIFRK